MRAAVDLLVGLAFLVVLVWVVAFGASNAMLARARGARAWSGFLLGILLGPMAWIVTGWRTRSEAWSGRADALQQRLRALPGARWRPEAPGAPDDDIPI